MYTDINLHSAAATAAAAVLNIFIDTHTSHVCVCLCENAAIVIYRLWDLYDCGLSILTAAAAIRDCEWVDVNFMCVCGEMSWKENL
jgi:hypothetical protein